MPVHQLLVRNHVAAVFKAHDNFYARQELDGIVYQMIPQPSFAGNDRIRDLETYGYKQGTFLGNSGHVRVAVSPDQVKVDYIRSYLPKDETDNTRMGKLPTATPFQFPKTSTSNDPTDRYTIKLIRKWRQIMIHDGRTTPHLQGAWCRYHGVEIFLPGEKCRAAAGCRG